MDSQISAGMRSSRERRPLRALTRMISIAGMGQAHSLAGGQYPNDIFEVGLTQSRPVEVGALKVRAMQIGFPEVSIEQGRIAEIGPGQLGSSKICAREISRSQFSSCQVLHTERRVRPV